MNLNSHYSTRRSYVHPRAFLPILLLLSGIGATAAHAGSAPPQYWIEDLGSLDGVNTNGTNALGINASGQVVGQSSVATTDLQHAFLWTYATGIQDISPSSGTGVASGANAININGVAVGEFPDPTSHNEHAFVRNTDGSVVDIGALIGGSIDNCAVGINSTNQVVGHFDEIEFVEAGPGYIWDMANGIHYPYTSNFSNLLAINDNGYFTGFNMDLGAGFGAFIWNGTGSPQLIGSLGYYTAIPGAINNNNQVVGQAGIDNSGSNLHAFSWDNSTGIHDLGALFSNYDSRATSINNQSQIVGTSYLNAGFESIKETNNHATLWQNGSMYDLNALLSYNPGWTLTVANGINDNGQIVGTGTLNGTPHAFLMTPVGLSFPKPITLAINPTTVLYKQWANLTITLSSPAKAEQPPTTITSGSPQPGVYITLTSSFSDFAGGGDAIGAEVDNTTVFEGFDSATGIFYEYAYIAPGATSVNVQFANTSNGPTTPTAVTITATHGTDLATAQYTLDPNLPPVTTSSLAGKLGTNGWYKGPVTVTLTATDPDGAANLSYTTYAINYGASVTYSDPFAISGDGTYTLLYWSTDKENQAEATNLATIKIDSTPPTTTQKLTGYKMDGVWVGRVTATLYPADATSGVAGTYYAPSSTNIIPYTGPFVYGSAKTHTWSYWSVDNAGNKQNPVKVTAIVVQPAITSITPASVTHGSSGATITINGKYFITGAKVNWNGKALSTTYVSATQLTATAPASDLVTSGTASVQVVNKLTYGKSNIVSYTIN